MPAPPIPRSALEKDPRPGPLFAGNPVGEGTTRRGTATPVHRPQRPVGATHSSTRGLRPPEHPETSGSGHAVHKGACPLYPGTQLQGQGVSEEAGDRWYTAGRGGSPSRPCPAPPPAPGSPEGEPADEEGGGLQPEEGPQRDPVLTAALHLLGQPHSQ